MYPTYPNLNATDDTGDIYMNKGGRDCRTSHLTADGVRVIGKTTRKSEKGRSDGVNGWTNEFLLNWEVGMANKFDTDPVTMRAKGKQSGKKVLAGSMI